MSAGGAAFAPGFRAIPFAVESDGSTGVGRAGSGGGEGGNVVSVGGTDADALWLRASFASCLVDDFRTLANNEGIVRRHFHTLKSR